MIIMTVRLCYFNQHWNVYLYTKEGYEFWVKNPETRVIKNMDGEFRLRTYAHPEIPIHAFGYWYNDPKRRPGHGGEWSSNSIAINKQFGTDLIEVAVDSISVAVPLSWLKELLGDNVSWVKDDIYGHKITSVKGHKNDYMEWVTLPIKQLLSEPAE